MIAWLSGTLLSATEGSLVLNVGGVGYQVFVSSRVLSNLPPLHAPLDLHIETNVREDHIHLYGFRTEREKQCFDLLTSVQGVGAKVGLAILSVFEPDDLLMALSAQDAKAIARANGVGPKLASRIVNELGQKAGAAALPSYSPAKAAAPLSDESAPSFQADAVSALENLGYDRSEAFRVVRTVGASENAPSDVAGVITAALKLLAQ